MLRTEFKNVVTTPIPSDVRSETVIKLLHDHNTMITLQPIVTRHSLVGEEDGKLLYDVWESIDFLPFGLWKHEIQFSCLFKDTPDGLVSWIQAPMGLVSQAVYNVKHDGEQGGLVLEETVVTSVNMFLKMFVESQLVAARKEMHQNLMDRATQ